MTGTHGVFWRENVAVERIAMGDIWPEAPDLFHPLRVFLDRLRYPHLALSWKLCNSKRFSYDRGDVILTQSSTILSFIHAILPRANCPYITGARELYCLLVCDVPQTFVLGSALPPS